MVIAPGLPPTLILARSAPLPGSIRRTCPSRGVRDPDRTLANGNPGDTGTDPNRRLGNFQGLRIDLRERAVRRAGRPDFGIAGSDPQRALANRDRIGNRDAVASQQSQRQDERRGSGSNRGPQPLRLPRPESPARAWRALDRDRRLTIVT